MIINVLDFGPCPEDEFGNLDITEALQKALDAASAPDDKIWIGPELFRNGKAMISRTVSAQTGRIIGPKAE